MVLYASSVSYIFFFILFFFFQAEDGIRDPLVTGVQTCALPISFQQVQKYEKGTNRIGASRLQQISHILQVPVEFFFEGAPNLHGSGNGMKDAPDRKSVV